MAKNSELIEFTGKVIDVLPNSTFKVKVDDTNHEQTTQNKNNFGR